MLVKTFSSALFGIDAHLITIEVNSAQGVNFFLVGLPDNAIKESQQRIKAALKNNQLRFPGKEITINLAPADLRKEGSAYDLPIALGILAVSEQMPAQHLDEYLILGELSLDGHIQPMRGVLPVALMAREQGFKGLILPAANAPEAALVDGLQVYGVQHLKEAIAIFEGNLPEPSAKEDPFETDKTPEIEGIDFNDVKGQENIKRAFEIAAAGGHNAILIGPPGAGKSMLAKRLPTILPPMTMEEALETTKIHSVAGKTGRNYGLVTERPFRKPHHTISDVALVGGGGIPQPGEMSLAHNGVLFLDELPEYKRQVLEVMRQPLEDRSITISRAKFTVDYPSSVMLIAAMNPCPCGYYNHPEKDCHCSSQVVQRYLNRVSGPLLDRIDLHVEVVPAGFEELMMDRPSENSATIRKRVIRARNLQKKRFEQDQGTYNNAQMSSKQIRKYCQLDEEGSNLLRKAMEMLGLSARAYDRILKVARTIADLDEKEQVVAAHIAEAIQYRSLDRSAWGN